MSYTGFGLGGGTTACYPFYERMVSCIQGEVLPKKMCSIQAQDYLECISKDKQTAFNYKLQCELQKLKLLAIPQYDEENDRFVVNQAIENADYIFQKK